MGDNGQAHEVGSFSSSTDDLYTVGILPVVYSRDYLGTWSTSVHSIRQGSQITTYFWKSFQKAMGTQWMMSIAFSSTDRWSFEEDHTSFRGHVTSMCPRS